MAGLRAKEVSLEPAGSRLAAIPALRVTEGSDSEQDPVHEVEDR
jgi:hypothetical protein